jgi:hypothetical protein
VNIIGARKLVLERMEEFEYMARLNQGDSNDKQALAASKAYHHAATALAMLAGRMLVEGIEQEEVE